jgi:four helix bundle protein
MARINSFGDLEAWKLAREITKEVYFVSNREKFGRDFGLRDQIRRASVSIMSNIAEGFERDGDREFGQFLSLARGSSAEARSQLCVALDQDYISFEEFERLDTKLTECSRMIAGFDPISKTI